MQFIVDFLVDISLERMPAHVMEMQLLLKDIPVAGKLLLHMGNCKSHLKTA